MKKNTETPFSKRLKLIREAKGLTQEQVATALSIEIGTLSGYERGYRRPSIEGLGEIAKYYGVTSDYLLGLDPVKAEHAAQVALDLDSQDALEMYAILTNAGLSKEKIKKVYEFALEFREQKNRP